MKSVLTKHFRAYALAVAALALSAASPALSQELNALIWCDHADPALLQPFEEANGVKVNVKEFEGTGAGLALVEQSQPGDWDVMVIDSIDIRRGVEKGLFEPLPEDQFPLADLFPEVKLDNYTVIDGKRYGITEKFGYNTIAYNKEKVDPEDMQSLSSLVDPKYKGRIAIYDYYLPVIGMAALSIGMAALSIGGAIAVSMAGASIGAGAIALSAAASVSSAVPPQAATRRAEAAIAK